MKDLGYFSNTIVMAFSVEEAERVRTYLAADGVIPGASIIGVIQAWAKSLGWTYKTSDPHCEHHKDCRQIMIEDPVHWPTKVVIHHGGR